MRVLSLLKQLKLNYNKYSLYLFFILTGMSSSSFAAPSPPGGGDTGGTTLATIAENITNTFSSLVKLITGGAYVVGFALAMVGILKLKAHKDNPTQIPISTGVALIFVGAALVFLPTLLGVGASTIFGSDATSNVSPSGTDTIVIQ